jgi:hypothetical protein
MGFGFKSALGRLGGACGHDEVSGRLWRSALKDDLPPLIEAAGPRGGT